MKQTIPAIPAIFLLTTAPALACVQGLAEALLLALVAALTTLLLTAAGQCGLLRLRGRHTLSALGKWTLGGLSSFHLLIGLGILYLGLGEGASGLLIAAIFALPLLILSRSGFRGLR
jgi:hypothetical protein